MITFSTHKKIVDQLENQLRNFLLILIFLKLKIELMKHMSVVWLLYRHQQIST